MFLVRPQQVRGVGAGGKSCPDPRSQQGFSPQFQEQGGGRHPVRGLGQASVLYSWEIPQKNHLQHNSQPRES